MKYQWGMLTRKAGDCQIVGEELERVRLQADGKLYPQDIVASAKRPASPLHKYFEWRDHVAAKEYRLQQAREIVRSVAVVFDEKPDTPVRAFVSVTDKDDERQYYTAIKVALVDPITRDQVIAKAMRELESWRRRYREYSELAAAFDAVDRVLELGIAESKAEVAGAAA